VVVVDPPPVVVVVPPPVVVVVSPPVLVFDPPPVVVVPPPVEVEDPPLLLEDVVVDAIKEFNLRVSSSPIYPSSNLVFLLITPVAKLS
jgi:hypothetical protein